MTTKVAAIDAAIRSAANRARGNKPSSVVAQRTEPRSRADESLKQ